MMQSLQTRLLVFFLLIEGALIVALAALVFHQVSGSRVAAMDADLQARALTLASGFEFSEERERNDEEHRDGGDGGGEYSDEQFGMWWGDGRPVESGHGSTAQFPQEWVAGALIGEMEFRFDLRDDEEVRVVWGILGARSDHDEHMGDGERSQALVIECVTSAAPLRAGQRALLLKVSAFGGLAFLLSLLGGLLIAQFAVRPIHRLTDEIGEISETNLDKRIDESGALDELRPVCAAFNETLNRLAGALQKERRFTADASHELRTPVSIILTASEVALKREREAEDYQQALTTSREAAERMSAVIESLETLAKADSGAAILKFEPLDLRDLVAGSIEYLGHLAEERGVDVSWERPVDAMNVSADEAHMRSLITNLIKNAIVHNRRGGQVDVTLREDGKHVALSVRDDGPGIDANHISKLFERFYRVDKARSREHGGSGLGLSIAKWVVEAHAGEITVESEVGKGTEFRVRIPR